MSKHPELPPPPFPHPFCRTCQAIIMAEEEEEGVVQEKERKKKRVKKRREKKKKEKKGKKGGKKEGRRQTRTLPSKVPMKSLFRDAAELRRDRNARLAPLPHHLAKLHKPPSHRVQQPSQQHPTPAPPPPALPPTPWQNKAASLSLSSQSRDVPAGLCTA